MTGGSVRSALRPVAVLACALATWAAPTAASASAAMTPLPPVRHVFVIMLENKGYAETFAASSEAPYLSKTLPAQGALLPDYYGVTHASLGNYIALVSGQGSNPITQSDCQLYANVVPGSIGPDGQAEGAGCVYPSQVRTLADQLGTAGLSWHGYMEDMGNAPGQATTCAHPAFNTRDSSQLAKVGAEYAARHDPFVYFHSLLDSGACARNVVSLKPLAGDLAKVSTTRNLTFITPNLCNDGHDAACVDGRVGGLKAADTFLRTWVPRITASPAYKANGLLAILFDEADGGDSSLCCNQPRFASAVPGSAPSGGGRMGAVLLSRFIEPGTVDSTAINHFSMLRSLENLFKLGHLGFAARPGLATLGASSFTCYRPAPAARHGRLGRGAAIKRIAIHGGTLTVETWHDGRMSVLVRRAGKRQFTALGRPRSVSQCQVAAVSLPSGHGRIELSVRVGRGIEQRTLGY